MCKSDFYPNLIQASESKTCDEAIKEWKILVKIEFKKDNKQKCICGTKNIWRNVFICMNVKNGNLINVGSDCIKKFEEKLKKTKNKLFNNFINDFNNEFEEIDDMDEYLKNVRKNFLIYLKNKIEEINNIIKLKLFSNELEGIILFLKKENRLLLELKMYLKKKRI